MDISEKLGQKSSFFLLAQEKRKEREAQHISVKIIFFKQKNYFFTPFLAFLKKPTFFGFLLNKTLSKIGKIRIVRTFAIYSSRIFGKIASHFTKRKEREARG